MVAIVAGVAVAAGPKAAHSSSCCFGSSSSFTLKNKYEYEKMFKVHPK